MIDRVRRRLRGFLVGAVLGALSLLAGLGVVELAYRGQWVDTYRPELEAYNPPADLRDAAGRETVLFLGDSFTAGAGSYPAVVRARLPRYRAINGGVSGTGIAQTLIMLDGRIREFDPMVCVYQIFVGNDLFDLRYPVRFDRGTLPRALYWSLANVLRSVGFANYRLGQMRAARGSGGEAGVPALREPFSVRRYDSRERLYLEIEPRMLENHVLVGPERRAEYARLLDGLERLRGRCAPPGRELALLVIPHACQVSAVYLDRMRRLGARFGDEAAVLSDSYPFLDGIVERFGKRPGVTILDPLPLLRREDVPHAPMYYTHDGHLTPRGQQLVGDLVVRWLARRPLLKSAGPTPGSLPAAPRASRP